MVSKESQGVRIMQTSQKREIRAIFSAFLGNSIDLLSKGVYL